jgi:membrane-associated phospholipid phosphatase
MIDLKNWLKTEKNELKSDFYHYPKRRILILLFGAFLLFWALFRLWAKTSSQSIIYWDNLIVNLMDQNRNPFWDRFFIAVTNFGSIYFIVFVFLILAIFLYKKRAKKAVVAVFLTLIGSGALIFLFKDLFSRERPFGCSFQRDCFSFPSGHATIAFYFYGMLFNLSTRFIKMRKRYAFILGGILIILICLIALSRVYLGYHFVTDIFGGFLLGAALLLIVAIMVDFLYQKVD